MLNQHKSIMAEIQRKRKLMIDLAQEKGLTSDDTLKCSQELDQLIYQYQAFFRQKQCKRDNRPRKIDFDFFSPTRRLKGLTKLIKQRIG